jgi:hypothetical protein
MNGISQPEAASGHCNLRLIVLERRVAELTALVEAMRGAAPAVCSVGLPRALELSADDMSSFGVGFYAREYDQHGTPFRWTGHGEFFELRFVLDRSGPRRVELRLRAPRATSLEPLSVFVDYAEVETTVAIDGQHVALSCVAPAAACAGRIVVSVYAPNTAIVDDTAPARAGRPVGVMFYSASVTSIVRTEAPAHG